MYLKKNREFCLIFCLFVCLAELKMDHFRSFQKQKKWNWSKGGGGNNFYFVEAGNWTAGKGEGNEWPFKLYLPTCNMLIPTWQYNDGCIALILGCLLWFCHWNPCSGAVLGKKSHSCRSCTMPSSWKVQVGVLMPSISHLTSGKSMLVRGFWIIWIPQC